MEQASFQNDHAVLGDWSHIQDLPASQDDGLLPQRKLNTRLAQCADGSFYYQPNRDNSGYGPDSRIKATAVAAFILSVTEKSLHVTGKPFK